MRGKKAIINIISNLLLQFIVIIYGFIVPKIIISNFGSNVNGLIASITQFLAYISLLESGFGPVVKAILYKPIAKKNKNEIELILKKSDEFFKRIALIFLAYIIVLCVIYPLIVKIEFTIVYTISLVIIIAISTFAEYFFGMTYKLFLQAKQKNYIISIVQILTYILSIIAIIMLVKFNSNIHIIKLVSGIIFVFRPLILNKYVQKKYNINLKNVKSNYEIKQKWDGLSQHIASVIHSNTDIVVLTLFSSLTSVSIYSVYYLIVKGVKSIIQSFTNGIDAMFGDMLAKQEFDNLNKKFNLYELIYITITTIVYTTAIVMITPFISIYMKNITDANYIQYLFGYLLVISEYIWAIRQPYNEIIKAAGHFKETRIGAWIEAIINIVISIILVWKYGLIGVAIGTIVAMSIRTVEFIYHTNKYILKRNIFNSICKVLITIIETIIIVIICNYLPFLKNVTYINWAINSTMVFVVSISVIMIINLIIYHTDMRLVFETFKNILKRKKHNLK